MTIFEVGINKTYNSISEAIFAAEDGDEIKIYPGFYNETFDCLKDLTFTGVPDDVKNFSTYPQIYNGDENQVNSIIGKCSFSNIIFVEQKAADFKDYEKILGGEKLADELIKKYRREEEENSHLEVFCLVVENEAHFENCHFIGGRNYGVIVDLNNTKKAPVFANCGFYLNYYAGIHVVGKKSSPAVVFQNCKFAYNGNGIYGGNFDLKDCKLHHNKANGVLFMANESRLEHCDLYRNGCGISGGEKGAISINETDIHTNYSEGINLINNSKLLMNKSEVRMNKDGVIIGGKSTLLAVDCEFKDNGGDGFLCLDKSEITLQNCLVSENEEKGIEVNNKAKVSVYDSRILNNSDDGVYAGKNCSINLRGSDFIENRNGVHLKGKAEGIINTCAFASNRDCELFVTENSKCQVEKSHFVTKQLPERHKKNERAVAVMCADKTGSKFNDCEFRSQKTKDTILAILMDEADGYFTDCIFQEAENGIVVYNRSGCEIKKCKFVDCANLDIYHKSKLTSWVVVEDTELSEATKKHLSITEIEIVRPLLPKLNEEERKIISMYYNLYSENPEEEYRLTGDELALYFNIPVKRVVAAFNKIAKLAEE